MVTFSSTVSTGVSSGATFSSTISSSDVWSVSSSAPRTKTAVTEYVPLLSWKRAGMTSDQAPVLVLTVRLPSPALYLMPFTVTYSTSPVVHMEPPSVPVTVGVRENTRPAVTVGAYEYTGLAKVQQEVSNDRP